MEHRSRSRAGGESDASSGRMEEPAGRIQSASTLHHGTALAVVAGCLMLYLTVAAAFRGLNFQHNATHGS